MGPGGFWGRLLLIRGLFVVGSVAVDSGVGGGVYVMAVDPNTGVVSVVKFSETGVVERVLDGAGTGLVINFGSLAVDPTDGHGVGDGDRLFGCECAGAGGGGV